ncbi:unnamed protein product [Phaeothamnion confervicola]
MAAMDDGFGAQAVVADGQAEQLNELKREYIEWLDGAEAGPSDTYVDRLVRLQGDPKNLRLLVDLNHLRQRKPDLARALIRRPLVHMFALREAAKDVALQHEPSFHKILSTRDIEIGFEGSLGHNHVSPRGLLSSLLRQLVCVEGIVTKCSAVRPKMERSVHYCQATKSHMQARQSGRAFQISREYRDATALDLGLDMGSRPRLPTGGVYPTKDDKGNLLETEYGLSRYRDHQMVTVQEMPERAPLGQLPRSIDVVCDNDLVDRVKPGDRLQVVGVYRALAGAAGGSTSGIFRTVLLANNVLVLGKDVNQVRVGAADIGSIRDLAGRPDILELLGRSLAPSIYGHAQIKRALVLQLLSGEEKNLANGTHLRGDINIMMVGDPSTAKSQLLRAVLHVAPLAINTTGRGSSGVGLTAAVTTDKETGERRLEAGAMVLADRGIVCIDEFDKMSELDRVAIHEVMEQQTVTIAKAGIHASLNARCSVVAAANPVYGQYNRAKRPQENIGLPDSLLSRFDLLFLVLDQMDPANDRAISDHVLRAHRYRRPGAGSEPEPLGGGGDSGGGAVGGGGDAGPDGGGDPDEENRVWERYHPLLHSRGAAGRSGEDGGAVQREELLCQKFLKKYLYYAKTRVHPKLTDEAREFIAAAYAVLRGKQDHKTLPVTARSLETIIRLSTAHAKARLSPVVEESDCRSAMDLLNFAFYAETAALEGDADADPAKSEADDGAGGGEDGEDSDGGESDYRGDDDVICGADSGGGRRKRKKRRRGESDGSAVAEGQLQERRWEFVQRETASLLTVQNSDSIHFDDLLEAFNGDDVEGGGGGGGAEGGVSGRRPGPAFEAVELRKLLEKMVEVNRVFCDGDVIYAI